MAQFLPALDALLKREGGYSMDDKDRGGETFMGISRRHNPTWAGWQTIDAKKRLPGFPQNLKDDEDLKGAVAYFFKTRYWDPLLLDEVKDNQVAGMIFDTSVLQGQDTAIHCLQRALNLLNRNGTTWPDIPDDGRMGPRTAATLAKALESTPGSIVTAAIALERGVLIRNLMRTSPVQERFARGWLKRLRVEGLAT